MDSCLQNKRLICHNNDILPDDCLYLIIEKLDERDDRDSFGLICHSFRDIQTSCRKVTELKALPMYAISDNRLIHNFLELLMQLDSLSLTQFIELAFKYRFKLHCLNSSFSPFRLSVISFYKCGIDDNGLKLLSETRGCLKQLDLAWCSKITDVGIWYLNKNCRKLRALRITGCNQITGVNFLGFAPSLACFEAKFCSLKSEYILGILSGHGFEYLNFSSPIKYPLGHKLGVIGSGYSPNLKILDLENCSLVADDDILKISKGCPLLQEWNLSYCYKIKINGWKYIGSYCQNLERLDVNGCTNLCDEGLLALINGCKRLSVINVTNCHQITAFGMSRILTFEKKIVQDFGTEKHVKQIVTPWDFTDESKLEIF